MSKKKVLYLMHVPWGWIKQRPHFIAEGLNKDYEVRVVFNKNYRMSSVNNDTTIHIVGLLKLPFGRIKIISKLNYFHSVGFLCQVFKILNSSFEM